MFGVKKRRELVIEEKDVTTVLTVINEQLRFDNLRVGNCGWMDEPTKWFVAFYANDKTHGRIIKDLMKIGQVNIDVRPGGKFDLRFERV